MKGVSFSCEVPVMKKVATFHSPLGSKFGTPRQAGVVKELIGRIVFEKEYRSPDAVRGMEAFDYLWLIWGFSHNKDVEERLTVRPPRLGGNKRVGVFASRSPYRPNALGLSSVLIERIDYDCPDAPVVYVKGADLTDCTPIYDVKPYIAYTDAHPDARGGFTDTAEWQRLEVQISEEAERQLALPEFEALRSDFHICKKLLAEDPRPHYHSSSQRIYTMQYASFDISFRVEDSVLTVVKITALF